MTACFCVFVLGYVLGKPLVVVVRRCERRVGEDWMEKLSGWEWVSWVA